jgi:hypothetical protein
MENVVFAAEISNYSTIYCRCYNVVDAKAIKNCAPQTIEMGISLLCSHCLRFHMAHIKVELRWEGKEAPSLGEKRQKTAL